MSIPLKTALSVVLGILLSKSLHCQKWHRFLKCPRERTAKFSAVLPFSYLRTTKEVNAILLISWFHKKMKTEIGLRKIAES